MSAYNSLIGGQQPGSFPYPHRQGHAQSRSGLMGLASASLHQDQRLLTGGGGAYSNLNAHRNEQITNRQSDVDYSDRCPICMKEQFILTQNPELSKENSMIDFMENLATCVNNLLGTKRLCNNPRCHSYSRINKLCIVLERLEKAFADLNNHIKDHFLPFENEEEKEKNACSFTNSEAGLQLESEEMGSPPEMDYNDDDDSNSGSFDAFLPTKTKLAKKKTSRKRVITAKKPTSSPITNIMTSSSFTESQLKSLSTGPPFICPESNCGKSFKQKHYLASHILLHTQEKPFACPKCGKTFRHNPSLFLHLRRHDGIKPYKCTAPNCKFAGVTKWALNSHIKQVHTSIRDVLCSYCPKTFSDNTQLNTHCRMQHPEKVNSVYYFCQSCPKSFATIRRLKVHIVKIHKPGEKKYICDECGKSYCEVADITRHKTEVHLKQRKPNVKKFECSYSDCAKKFYRKVELECHERVHLRRIEKSKKKEMADKVSDKEEKVKRKPKSDITKSRKRKSRKKQLVSDTEDELEDNVEVDDDIGLAPNESLLSNIEQGQLSINKILNDTSDEQDPRKKRKQRLRSLITRKKQSEIKSKRNRTTSKSNLNMCPEEEQSIISSIISGKAKEIKVEVERLMLEEEQDIEIKQEHILEDGDLK